MISPLTISSKLQPQQNSTNKFGALHDISTTHPEINSDDILSIDEKQVLEMVTFVFGLAASCNFSPLRKNSI